MGKLGVFTEHAKVKTNKFGIKNFSSIYSVQQLKSQIIYVPLLYDRRNGEPQLPIQFANPN